MHGALQDEIVRKGQVIIDSGILGQGIIIVQQGCRLYSFLLDTGGICPNRIKVWMLHGLFSC